MIRVPLSSKRSQDQVGVRIRATPVDPDFHPERDGDERKRRFVTTHRHQSNLPSKSNEKGTIIWRRLKTSNYNNQREWK